MNKQPQADIWERVELIDIHQEKLPGSILYIRPSCRLRRRCENKTYGDLSELPPASVVMSFHTHEDLVEILHTLHSLVQRSPARLLREIVIVDDHSYNGTWTYKHGSGMYKTFWTWDFVVGFTLISPKARAKIPNKTDAIPNPVNMGTFAISKSFFVEIGEYDDDMLGWGGDNVELSLRVWLFGGRIVKVPCSRMAHLEKEGYRDYRNNWHWQTMANFRRVVDLWGDDYKQTFFDFVPDIEKVGAQDVTKRLYLKKKAKHDLSWYIKHIYPELLETLPHLNSYALGGVGLYIILSSSRV
ncbi:hypothetical protein NP493_8g05002 [Ridgeia piscesae]|uniref:Galactosyltransferase C-terminal domain-containing protein n=1 Tax=Ridgeia piscesae TaxID=27915 RepID=A0AAD9PF74_RIDPI|nr:hypothetical protein NP493_8g05002 [Ridgeia piscesae]